MWAVRKPDRILAKKHEWSADGIGYRPPRPEKGFNTTPYPGG